MGEPSERAIRLPREVGRRHAADGDSTRRIGPHLVQDEPATRTVVDSTGRRAALAARRQAATGTGTCRRAGLDLDVPGDRRARRRRPVRLRRPGRGATPELDDLRRRSTVYADRPGEPPSARSTPSAERGNAGLVQVLDACGGMLSARRPHADPADVRGCHPYGVSRPARLRGDGHRRDAAPPARRGRAARPRVGPRPGRRTTRAGAALPGRTGRRGPVADPAAGHRPRPGGARWTSWRLGRRRSADPA